MPHLHEIDQEEYKIYSNIIKKGNDGIVILQDHLLKFLNPKMEEIVGYPIDEVLGKPFIDFVAPEFKELVVERYKKRMEKVKVPEKYEIALVTKDGEEVPVEINASIIEYQGMPADMAIIRDISERRNAERALKESQQTYSHLVETSPDSITITDLEGNFTFSNLQGARLHGCESISEFLDLKLNAFDIIHPGDKERALQNLHRTLEDGFIRNVEYRIITKNGDEIPVEVSASILTDENGEPKGFIGIARNISRRLQVESEIKETQLQYKSTIDSMETAIHVVDRDMTIIVMNETFFEWNKELGLETEAVGKKLIDVFPFLDKAVLSEYEYVFETGETLNSEETNLIGGKRIISSTKKIPVFEGEKVDRIVTVVRDITQQVRSEEALLASQQRYATLIRESPEAIITITPDGIVDSINPEFTNLFGYTKNQMVGREFLELALMPPEKIEEAMSQFQKILETSKGPAMTEWEVVTKYGDTRVVAVRSSVIMDKDDISQVLVTIRDITERKKVENAVKESEERFRALADTTSAGTFIHRGGNFLFFNQATVDISGYSEKELKEMNFLDVVHPDYKDLVKERAMARLRGEEAPSPYEIKIKTKSGEERWVELTAHDVMFEEEKAVIGTAFDITARKRAEEARKRNEERLEILHEIDQALTQTLSIDAIVQTALKGVVDLVDCSRTSVALIMEDRERVNIIAIVKDEDGTLQETGMLMSIDDFRFPDEVKVGNVRVYEDITKDDRGMELTEMLIESGIRSVINVPITVQEELIGTLNIGRPFTGDFAPDDVDVANEVADSLAVAIFSKRAEEALRESEERFRNIYENASVGMYRTTPDGQILMANPTLIKLLGYDDFDDLATLNLEEEGFSPNYRRIDFKERIENEGSITGIEAEWTKKDGSVIYIRESAKGVWDDSGNILFYEGSVEDITKRRMAELKLESYQKHLEDLVRERTQKLEESNAELESFAYSVSHDLRAPLRAMHGFSTALHEDYNDVLDEQGREYAQRIITASRNMDKLIMDLLMYSRLTRGEIELDILGLERALDEALKQLEEEINENGAVIDIKKPLPEVIGNPTTLNLIITNLIHNAIKFHKPDEPPKVEIWAETKKEMVFLYVKDYGIGIDPKYREKVFRVFERLHGKNLYPGTGIGLAIVKKGVERLDGKVDFESTPGKETIFWLELQKPEED